MHAFTQTEKAVLLAGDRIYLRPLTPEDATSDYVSWLNDTDINRFLETRRATIESIRDYINEKNSDPYSLFLGVFLKERDRHIGNVKLRFVDLRDIGLDEHTPEIGIMVGDKAYAGHGMGKEAMSVVHKYAFDTLGFSYMSLGVLTDNERAIRSYHRQGFIDYHRREHFVCYDGVWYNHITMLLTKEHFVSVRNVHKV